MGISKVIAKRLLSVAEKVLPAEKKAVTAGKNIFTGTVTDVKGTVRQSVLNSAAHADNAVSEISATAKGSVFKTKVATEVKQSAKAAEKTELATPSVKPKTAAEKPATAPADSKIETQGVKPQLTPQQVKEAVDFPPVENYFKSIKNFETLSDDTKLKINILGERIRMEGKYKNNSYGYKYVMSRFRELVNYCDDEKAIKMLVSDDLKFCRYLNNKGQLFNKLGKYRTQNIADVMPLKEKLYVMSVLNPESFNALWKSKGMSEIAAGRLNFSYLNDVKVFDKIDDDFFYKMFDKIEKSNIERLKKSGIDSDLVMKYLKLPENDEMVCMRTDFADNVITSLEKVNNPELVNKILKTCKFDKYWDAADDNYFKYLIKKAIEDTKIVSKVMRIEKNNPYSASQLVKLLEDKDNYKISDELFEQYLKFEKSHPDVCFPMTLARVNDFLKVKGADEKLVQKIFDNADKLKQDVNISDLFACANEHNLALLNKCVEKGSMTPAEVFQYYIIGRQRKPLSDEIASKLFNETYTPLAKELASKSGGRYFVMRLSELKAIAPETYQKLLNINITDLIKSPEFDPAMLERYINILENPAIYKRLTDSKLLGLIKDKKVNPRIILQMEYGELRPEVLSDIQKLLHGESLIKKFDSTKNVLKMTKAGDVISVKGKMYINNNGKLEPWNMTEEKFNELFPLVDRFVTEQRGIGDCYFLTAIDGLYRNPLTRGKYYKMFELCKNGKGVKVTIPAYKDFKGTTYFYSGRFKENGIGAAAAQHVQMVEKTYAKVALRRPKQTESIMDIDPGNTTDTRFLYKRIQVGNESTVVKEIIPAPLGQDGAASVRNFQKKKAEDWLKNYAGDPRYVMSYSFHVNKNSAHAVAVSGYDPIANTVTLRNPWHTAVEYKIPLVEYLEKFNDMTLSRIG